MTAALLLMAQTATADAKRCIKGALVGGVWATSLVMPRWVRSPDALLGSTTRRRSRCSSRTVQAT